MQPEIVARECRFAIHIPERHNIRPDLHLIKEQQHFSDGTVKPAIRLVKDFKRNFWVTKPSARNYKQKREWQHTDNLLQYECTDSQLRDAVAKALGLSHTNDHLKKLSVSPYLYGTDITAASLIKKGYMDKYPNARTAYTVASFDIETKLVGDKTIITMATVAMKGKVFTSVASHLVKGISNPQMALDVAMKKYLPDHYDKYEFELDVAKNELDIIKNAFKKVHEWCPDILAIWNMNYDIPRIMDMLERYRTKPEDIFCDPNVPEFARICKYKEGKKKKVTASGKVTPISPAAQWHTLIVTAGYYVLDAMCVYKLLRLSKQEQPSYALDAILKAEGIGGKLKFTEADKYSGLRWHQFMQENYPIEYIVYNRYDCISMLELDDKTKDLTLTLPEFAYVTEFSKFNSQPKRIADALFFYLLETNYVLGCVGFNESNNDNKELDIEDEEEVEETGDVLSLAGWIVTLPAELQVGGLRIIDGIHGMQTNIRGMVYDSDAVAAYPTATKVSSVSKETTVKEIIEIKGIKEELFRLQNINLLAGPVNAIEYCVNMFKMPKPEQLLKIYKETHKCLQ